MELYGVLAAVAIGVVAGLMARAILPRSGMGGWIGDVVVGVMGALFGAFLVYSMSIGHTMVAPVIWYTVVGFAVAGGFLTMVRSTGPEPTDTPD